MPAPRCAMPSPLRGWRRVAPASMSPAPASTESWCVPISAWQTATASNSTARSPWTRRRRGAAAPGGARLLAPLGDGLLRAVDVARALVIIDVHALARGVDGADALSALQLPQARLRALAVGTFLLADLALLGRLLLLLLALLLALAERRLRTERRVLFAFRRRRRRSRGRRLHRRGVHAGGRRVAVADLAVLLDPFVHLRRSRRGERERSNHHQVFFHLCFNVHPYEWMTVSHLGAHFAE